MELHDLPLDVFQIIIEILVATTTLRTGCRLREVNSFWAQLVEREYMKRRSEFIKAKPLVYGKHRLSEAEVFSAIRNGLLSPRSSSPRLCSRLRPSVAILMNTPELQFPDIIGDTEVESQGFLEDYREASSQGRLIKIVELLTATVICSAGLEGAIDLLLSSGGAENEWFWTGSHNPLEWAAATAVFMENFSAAKALLAAYSRVDLDDWPGLCLKSKGEDPEEDTLWYGRRYLCQILRLAIKKCSYEMTLLALENKADVNEERVLPPRETALQLACQRGSFRLVKLILNPRWEMHDSFDHYYWQYLLAIQYAAQCRCSHHGTSECDERIAIIELLTNRKAIADIQNLRQKVLAQACTWGCPNITRMMLDTGANLNAKGQRYKSALIYAASHGQVELMEYLLERGAPHLSIFFPLNAIRFTETAANPDMMIYLSDRGETIMQFGPLEQAKADFILKTAATKNCARVVKLLIRAGFDLPTRDRGAQAGLEALSNAAANVAEVLKDY